MSIVEIVNKPLPAVRLAARREHVQEQPQVVTVVGPAFDAVAEAIGSVPGALETAIAEYEMREDGLHMVIGYAYDGEPRDDVELVELPAVEEAFCCAHLGEISRIAESWQSLHTEIVAHGFQPYGPCREQYLRADESGRDDEFVVELQQPVRRMD